MRIRELRKQKGLTQQELAERIGVSRVAVTYWELNAKLPASNKLPLLAEVLGCRIDELFDAPRQFIS